MATVTFENAGRTYPGSARPAVDHLDLHVEDGEFLVLVGPSGCGKSTALRMIAGLEDLTTGRILIGERDVTAVAPKDRDIAMVFQSYALYPHMTVADNLGFALKLAEIPPEEIARRVVEAAAVLDLTEFLDRHPEALSGGQRQRVALGRAIVRRPQVFLMDEPLSNLDAPLRQQTREQIASLQRRLGVTTIYVTHDQHEALTMADRICVLREGRVQQIGSPQEVYARPANAFVAALIGAPAMNLITLPVTEAGVAWGDLDYPITPAARSAAGRTITVGLRPEDITVGEHGLAAQVERVELVGPDAIVHTTPIDLPVDLTLPALGGEAPLRVVVRVDGDRPPQKGSTVRLATQPRQVHLFHPDSGARL